MEDLLVRFGIVFGKRYNLKQRQTFLLAINEEFTKLGYLTKFANNERKNNARSVDLFIGDIAKASTIICAHFDTPMKVLWPNYHYYPLNGQRSLKDYWLVTFIPGILATIFGALLIYLIIANPYIGGSWRPYLIFITVALSFLLATLVSKGLSNKYNINRNTASVLTILKTAEKLKKDPSVAFVLLDKGCSDNSGAQMLKQALPTTLTKKLFIYLDCIGDGENVIIAHKEHLAKESDNLKKHFKGSQNISSVKIEDANVIYTPAYFFKRCITITNGYYDKKGDIFVRNINTDADKYANIPTLEAISDMLATSFKEKK